jgi:hypothetical protein
VSHSHNGAPSAPPPRNPLIQPSKPRIIPHRGLSTLHQSPPEPLITQTRDAPETGPLPGLTDRQHKAHLGRELLVDAAALYIACILNGENRTQKVLTEAADVTDVTIRNRYTELKRILDLDM